MKFWIAWPAAPFTRLSTAPTTTAVPVRGSATACSSITFVPRVRFESTIAPGGSTRTNGAASYAAVSASDSVLGRSRRSASEA